MGTKHHSIKQIAVALEENSGEPILAAKALGLTRQAINDRVSKSAELRKVIAGVQDRLKAKCRGNIEKAIEAGDGQMTRWFAERKMRDEYGTRIAVDADTAALERLAEAIAQGGAATIRAVQAALGGNGITTG